MVRWSFKIDCFLAIHVREKTRSNAMTRRLSGLVIVDGTDDEYWPQSDERVHREFPVQMVLEVNQPASAIEIPDVRWGGECRVEVRLTARALAEGVVQIEGNAKFFEGTSEGTQDLADEKNVSFLGRGKGVRYLF
jgi:hypothetical protein